MSLKIKLIITGIISLVIIVSVICLFVYIKHLNSKIVDLNTTITNQDYKINNLKCNIESLEKDVESFRKTISITNDYINSIEKVRTEESTVKDDIYKTVTKDPVAKEWYDEQIPQTLLNNIVKNTNTIVCK
jgi:peptidoglycan hydrolase CwlO-like protein